MTYKLTSNSSALGVLKYFRAFVSPIVASPKFIAVAFIRNRTRVSLHRLDDRILKDMGIARSEIHRIALLGDLHRSEDP